jgi:DNA-binding response OmpR family regulator
MAYRLLLIDDDERLHELLTGYLSAHDFHVTSVYNGQAGLDAATREGFDVVCLDVMMPGIDGLEVLRQLRTRSDVPVVMLTARGDDTDRVVGLELGADDYLPKPFNPRELLARLRAVLRRASNVSTGEVVEVQDVKISVAAREVLRGGEVVELTGVEFDLLLALARRAGRVVSRDALLSAAGRDDVVVGDRTVDVHISHIRQALGDDPRAPQRIRTVRGVGYVFVRESVA